MASKDALDELDECEFVSAKGTPAPGTVRFGRSSSTQSLKTENDSVRVLGAGAIKDEMVECGNSSAVGVADVHIASGDGEDDQKECLGCGRAAVGGLCWITSEPMMWGFKDMKGQWCKDCFNCWRLMFQAQCSLHGFGIWLKASNDNFDVWETTYAAYLSLRRDGIERISESMVRTRIDTFRFLTRLLGMPLQRGPVVLAVSLPPAEVVDPNRFMPLAVRSPDGTFQYRLGYLRDMPVAEATTTMARPTDSCIQQGFKWRNQLMTDSAEDLQLMSAAFPDCLQRATAQEGKAINTASPTASSRASPKVSKVDNVIGWAQSQLAPFACQDWENLRESFFSATLNKLGVVKVEVAGTGNDDEVEVLEGWTKGLTTAKVFLKRHREFLKTKKVAKKVSVLHPWVGQCVDFLTTTGRIKVDASLVLLRLRVQFVCAEGPAWGDHLASLVASGLDSALSSLMAVDSNISIEGWTRSLIFGKVADDITTMDVSACETQRPLLRQACGKLVQVLQSLRCADKLSQLVSDLRALIVMFDAGTEAHRPAANSAASASEALSSVRFTLLRQALDKAPAGVEFMSSLQDLLQRGAQDGVADTRLDQALAGFKDGTSLRMVPWDDHGSAELSIGVMEIRNTRLLLVGDPSAFHPMDGVLNFLIDAIRMWSPVRLVEQGKQVESAVIQLCSWLDLVDITMAWLLFICSSKCIDGFKGSDSDMAGDVVDYSMYGHTLSAEVVQKDGAFMCAWTKFLTNFKNFGVMVKDTLGEVSKLVRARVDTSMRNMRLRSDFSVALDIMKELASDPSSLTPSCLFHEWFGSTDGSKTNLRRALSLAPQLEKLMVFDFPHDFGSDVVSLYVSRDKVSDTWDELGPPVQFDMLVSMPSVLATLPLVSQVQECLQMVGPEAVNNFAKVVEFGGLCHHIPAELALEEKDISGLVGIFLQCAAMGQSRMLASAVFQRPNETVELKSDKAFDILKQCLNLLNTKAVTVTDLVMSQCEVDVDHILVVCNLLCTAHAIASAFLFLMTDSMQPESCMKEGAVREDLLAAVDFAEQKSFEGIAVLDSDSVIISAIEASPVCWAMPFAAMRRWLGTVAPVAKEIRLRYYRQAVYHTQRCATTVEKRTPKSDHFCNDETVAMALLKRLPKHTFTADLPNDVIVLYRALKQIGDLSARFGFQNPDEDPTTKDPMEHARLTFLAGKKAVAVTAAANILFNLDGKEKEEEAKAMIAKRGSSLPKALLEILEAAAKLGGGGVTRGTKRTAEVLDDTT